MRSTKFNDSIIMEGMKAFAKCISPLAKDEIDNETRELLMYASCLAGIAITHTGTTLVHAMGYSLTYFRGYSHGRANAMLMGEYLRFNEKGCHDKIEEVLEILGFDSIDELDEYFSSGDYEKLLLTEKECKTYAELAMEQGSVRLNPRTVRYKDIEDMYQKVFGGTK
jgi:alcohol dehydrogenase class IV